MPSPALFFETMNAFQRTAALRAAVELDVFTAIAEGHRTSAALAVHCKAPERGMRILCDYLTILGFLLKSGHEYVPTEDSDAFLNRKSQSCVAAAAEFWGSKMQRENFEDLAATIRNGGTTIFESGNTEAEHPVWVKYARGMASVAALTAPVVAKLAGAKKGEPWKVLDIAAGHGMFGIAVALQNPQARIVALDWAPVLEVARENAVKAGIADRYDTIAGSAFDVDLGEGYDLTLITNFLHHFDPATCEVFLRRVFHALKPGGRAATVEFVPNDDRVSPAADAAFSLVMLASTPAGDAYTYAEYRQMFSNAGFSRSELHRMEERSSALVLSTK
jgi:2-polyprenyl-3-methyl-5-hydroxy-6-metoxy-1,4-benzoquinol methylase